MISYKYLAFQVENQRYVEYNKAVSCLCYCALLYIYFTFRLTALTHAKSYKIQKMSILHILSKKPLTSVGVKLCINTQIL